MTKDEEKAKQDRAGELIEIIGDKVEARALLEQLAEELAEAGQAAMKLCRALGNGNPTPVSVDDAWNRLGEELDDVQVIEAVIGNADVKGWMVDKLERWNKRLEEMNDE